MPSLTGMTLPINTSMASVPASIRSSLVTTASVLLPEEKYTHLDTENTASRSVNEEVMGPQNEILNVKIVNGPTINTAVYHQGQPRGLL